MGFEYKTDILFIVLKQKFIIADTNVELAEVETFLNENGFVRIKRNDYYNKEFCIWLEDIHDENVIKQNNGYFLIDTVFYIDTDYVKLF